MIIFTEGGKKIHKSVKKGLPGIYTNIFMTKGSIFRLNQDPLLARQIWWRPKTAKTR